MENTNTKTSSGTFRDPISGTTERGRVRLLGYGDIPGNGPSFLTVDENGVAAWEPFGDVRITEPSCLPLSDVQLTAIQQNVEYLGRAHKVTSKVR